MDNMATLAIPLIAQTSTQQSPLQNALRRLARHRSAQVGFAILGFMILVAIFAPVIAPYDPTEVIKDVKPRAKPCIHLLGCPAETPQHIFGIDGNRRDLLSRVIYGSRLSLEIGVSTVSFGIIIGVLLGSIAGF